MNEVSAGSGFRFLDAKEEDWDYIRKCMFETSWSIAGVRKRNELGMEGVRKEAEGVVNKLRPYPRSLIQRLMRKPEIPNQAFILLTEKDKVAGTLWIRSVREIEGKNIAYVTLLFVEPTYRRQGLGRMLLAKAKVWAQEHGMDEMKLNVAPSNQEARDFYEKNGFEIEKIRMYKML